MRIIFFNTYNKSFLSDFFVELCSALSHSGHVVTIYSLKKENSSLTLDSGLTIRIFKRKTRFSNYLKLFKIINKERPDVVVSNFSFANPVVLSSKILRIKHNIIWFHTLKKQMDFNKRNIFIKSLFMDMATKIITNSLELKEEVHKDYRQPIAKIHSLPFTTNVDFTDSKNIDIKKEKGKIYIGCPGRINRDKNQTLIIDALPYLDREAFVLVFAGAKDEDILEKHKNYEQYKHQIVYLGILSREQMVDFYHQMDLIVLPSLNEAFGLVLIEALASGANTIVSNRFGALDYIKDDVESITFDPKNVLDLAKKIKSALQYKNEREFYRNLYYDNFSMDQIVNQFSSIISR